MTLRTRLVVTTLGVAVPLALGLFLVAQRSRHADMDQRLDASIDAASCGPADDIGRPGRPGGPGGRGGRAGPPVEVMQYDAALQLATRDGRGPIFPDGLRDSLLSTGRADGTWSTPDGRGRQLALRVTGDGRCAYVLARIRPRPGEYRDQLIALGSVVLTVFVAVLVAAGPTLSRIRRLAGEVRAAAASRYTAPVTAEGRDEVASLAHAFNEAGATVRAHIDQVETREAALRDFVANTTHDVAVPLTVLQTHLSQLEQQPLPPESTATVHRAMREAHYMGSLLRNLSAASRLDGGLPAQLGPVDLNVVLERTAARHQPLARAAGVELNVGVPASMTTVTADPTLLEQALGNLIDNAIRYNHAGGHVAVVLDHATAGNSFVLKVSDDGAGVSPEDLPRLSQRRFRGAHARTRQPGGQGLGLAIVAEVTDLLGWTVTFVPGVTGGLTVELRGRRQNS